MLHLDKHERFITDILNPVYSAYRYVHGLKRTEHHLFFISGYSCLARHDKPVFTSLVMKL